MIKICPASLPKIDWMYWFSFNNVPPQKCGFSAQFHPKKFNIRPDAVASRLVILPLGDSS